ncbi:nitrite reductase small subunit NirD [Paenibacillus sp. SYP-B4298]|uniref:nitrite reductase small subunit NirD n=1 Tax=Paenibacillus sp. SYP-B4298 TaxID=2996034 RepID=UPI0022DD46D8|nr:nitrite reductase small subunit NirD [Paenibacillus sp. SYP-B4298]
MSNKVKIGDIGDIDAKGARILHVGDTELAVFRLSDGTIRAVENRCPHKGGKLSEGMVCGSSVHCPLHDWRIDLHTGQVHEPDEGCVPTYPTEVDRASGSVYIKL